MQKIEKLVPDTSVIIESLVSDKIEKKDIKVEQILIHEAILSELEHQANQGRAIGFLGLTELKKLEDISKKQGFKVKFLGKKPSAAEIKYASLGEIDALIRDLAWEQDATLITADKVQNKVAEAKGMKFIFIEPKVKLLKKLKLEGYFDETTMSVHLRENVFPYAKKGLPGNWNFTQLSSKVLSREDVQNISKEIIEEAKTRKDSSIEIERSWSTIVQLANYRVVITRPPFSDGWEITAVRPIKQLELEEYKLEPKLLNRVETQAEGILIAGAPGHGKTTFCAGLARFYALKGKIVKTIEAPRDLVLPETITQFAISHGDAQEMHDILLLSRPDYTVFDEMRNYKDFQLFADLRLSGIGLAGVIHATKPIDAIQRFLGKIELGLIPHIIDTVIFIKNGAVDKVLTINMLVKVPSGMTEADLARPVVEVRDFTTNNLEFEIYTYGEETTVVPVSRESKMNPASALAAKQIEAELLKHTRDVKVDLISSNKAIIYVPKEDVAYIIGKQGKNIEQIEKKLGLSIDVKELEKDNELRPVVFDVEETKKYIILKVDPKYGSDTTDIYVNDQFLLTATVGKKGEISISKKNKVGIDLSRDLNANKRITVSI